MRKLSLFILLISTTVILNAQIQITFSDLLNILEPGRQWLQVSNGNVQTTMNVGSASGSSQNWTTPIIDFSDTITAVNISLTNSWYSSDFPEATHCQDLNNRTLSENYYKLDNTGLYYLGFVHDTTLYKHINNRYLIIDTIITIKNNTNIFPLPLIYGASKHEADTTDDGFGKISIATSTQSVDAFGNFTFPFGTYSALRILENTKTQNYVNGIFQNEDDQLSISWITTAGIFQVDVDSSSSTSGTINITSARLTKFNDAPTAINDGKSNIFSSFTLYQNFPNPFNPSTKIEFTVLKRSRISIKIYNINGQLVKELLNEEKNSGDYIIMWDGQNEIGTKVASGTYFYQIKAGDFTQIKKMLLLK
ncbi:MAG: T9SS type A sorting domain-containing protein [Ignavibacteriae bacterium]|nr:T9SS type A sorting domain-containing protein [Ignavibacteriota bacterium]